MHIFWAPCICKFKLLVWSYEGVCMRVLFAYVQCKWFLASSILTFMPTSCLSDSWLISHMNFFFWREIARFTNVGQLLERMGKELLGSSYKDPISSFNNLQKFSVENSKVYAVFLSRMHTLDKSHFSHMAFHYYI